MSPEQVTGKDVDRRSDVFALGIVLYEVATARRLFKGDNDFLTMSAIVGGDIPRPTELRPDLPRPLEEIIMTALAGLPKDRFQTCEELRAELEVFTKSLGMRMSSASIASYMRQLFGQRAEPWLVDDEPTLTTTIDFDGSETGVVSMPEVAIKSHEWRPTRDSPMAYALETATGIPVPSEGGNSELPWASGPTKLPDKKRSGGRIAAIAVTAALVAGGGMFGVLKLTGSETQAIAKTEPTKVDPAAKPEPTKIEEPARPEAPAKTEEPAKADEAKTEPAKPEPPKTVAKPEPTLDIKAAVKPAVKPEPVKARPAPAPKKIATVKKPPPSKPKQQGSAWDPNALFAPK